MRNYDVQSDDMYSKFMNALERLEDIIENAESTWVTNKIKIDKNEIDIVMKEIKMELPEEFNHFRWLKEQREVIMDDAQKQADELIISAEHRHKEIIDNAKQEKKKMLAELDAYIKKSVEQHEIVRHAKVKANEIIANAQAGSKEIRLNSYSYANDMLNRSYLQLEKTLRAIDKDRKEMQKYTP